MVIDLTGLEIANASLLDEATAAAEAMTMASAACRSSKSLAFFVDSNPSPQTVDVVRTRAALFGFELVFGALPERRPGRRASAPRCKPRRERRGPVDSPHHHRAQSRVPSSPSPAT